MAIDSFQCQLSKRFDVVQRPLDFEQMSEAERLQRIDELVRAMRDAQQELQALTAVSAQVVTSDGPSSGQSAPHTSPPGGRQAEPQLAEQQLAEQQLGILNALPAHIALLDADGLIVSVNDTWRRFSQANVLQADTFDVGVNYLAVCEAATGDSAHESSAAADGIRRVLRGELPEFWLEYPCHSPTERRWFRLMVTPVLPVGRGGAVVMHVNISAQRLADERLRESLARSIEVERIAQLGSWEMSLLDIEHLSNNPITVSDELLRIVGGRAAAASTHTAADLARLLPSAFLEAFRIAVETALRDGQPYSLVHHLHQPDGDVRVVHVLGRCFFDEVTGRPLKLVGTAQDVTEQTRVEDALRSSEREQRMLVQLLEVERARLTAAQQVARVGSWETDLTTLEVIWSDETHRIFETNPATFRPDHPQFLEHVHPHDRAAVDAAFIASLSRREQCSIEHRILLPDDRVKVVEERWQTIFDDDGSALCALGTCQDVTERRQADVELRTSRDLLRIASNAARLGGWRLDLPSETITISDELRAIHDAPVHAQPSFNELLDLYEPEARAELNRHMEACRRDGTAYDVELPKRTVTGRHIWLRSVGEAVRDADGRIIRLQGAGQDVTSHKLAERELARMNRALRMLSHCSDVLVRGQTEQELLDTVCRIAADDGGYLLAWVGFAEDDPVRTISVRARAGANRHYLDDLPLSWSGDVSYGHGPAGRTIRSGEFVACRDVCVDESFAAWRERAVDNGIRSVLCFPLREGERTFGVLCLYAAEVSASGTDETKLLQELADDLAWGIVGLRAREKHRASEQKLREQAALLDEASEAIFVRDLDDRITSWNHGAQRLYGWSADEVIGRQAAELLHDTDAAAVALAHAANQQVLRTGAWAGELTKFDKSKRARLIAARWSLLRDASGQPRAILTLNVDITEKRQLETQLLRTQRLEGIGTLAGGIAHDLNNVLTPILASIAMLREDEVSAKKRDDLTVIEASAQRGAAMVRQLLSFARGEPQGPHQRVDVVAIAGEVVTMIRETFPKDISSVLQPGEQPWAIHGDATQIHQLITNLCVNARDALPDGGRITIALRDVELDRDVAASLSSEARPGRWLLVRVEDTGVGMAPEVGDRIFEPFFTTKAFGKGTGLGLSTCHSIARNHKGFIVVSSELGKGSRFDVYLPADLTTPPTPAARSAPVQLPRGNGELVLVVDDEAAIRTLSRRILERFGYKVLVAENGAEAVALYEANAADIAVVITDMSMPVMDGPTAVVMLKALNPAVRIVGSSGIHADGKAEKARSLGVSDWLAKPYTTEALLQLLRMVIGA